MKLVGLTTLGVLAACAGNSSMSGMPGTVAGSVTYREHLALPTDAALRVQLFDMTGQDSVPAAVADTTLQPEGRQVPLPFLLRYDPKDIDPTHVYALRATILSGTQAIFTTHAVVKVITWDYPDRVDLVLTRVTTSAAAASDALWGTSWVLEDIGGTGVTNAAPATLEFPAQGKVAGHAPCNRFFGTVTLADSTIAFGPLGATRMACADSVMDQESRYLKGLQGAVRYSVEGDVLTIATKAMDRPLRFTRQGRP